LGGEFCEWHQRFARNQRIDREHFQRIKLGMRQEDIEEILGGPPGDYSTPVSDVLIVGCLFFEESRQRKERWKECHAQMGCPGNYGRWTPPSGNGFI
jgi:hypothetical protein